MIHDSSCHWSIIWYCSLRAYCRRCAAGSWSWNSSTSRPLLGIQSAICKLFECSLWWMPIWGKPDETISFLLIPLLFKMFCSYLTTSSMQNKYDYCIGTSEHGKQMRSSDLSIPKCRHVVIVCSQASARGGIIYLFVYSLELTRTERINLIGTCWLHLGVLVVLKKA